jgi:phage/conjugal plasmid C-4 type zinc finger TraR family protein
VAGQFDIAQELDARYLRQALEVQRRKTMQREATCTVCIDCGEDIPEARRKAQPGCERCIDCAQFYEETQGRF